MQRTQEADPRTVREHRQISQRRCRQLRCLPFAWPVSSSAAPSSPEGAGSSSDTGVKRPSANCSHSLESPEEHHFLQLVLGNGAVHHCRESWLLRSVIFCGKCGAWSTSAPRLLVKACTNLPKRVPLKGLEPNRRTVWPCDTPVLPRRVYFDSDS